MRIAIFTESFLPKIDGVVRILCHLLDHLELRGHESILFAPHGGVEQYANTKVVGLPGFRFPLYPELKLVPPWARFRKEINEFDPEVIVLINPASLGLAGLQYARYHNIPVAASYNTDIPGYAKRWGVPIFKKPLYAYFRMIYNHTDLNFVPSEFTRDEIRAHGIKRVIVSHHGVDMGLFNPGKYRAEWRDRLSNGHPDAPLLLFAGRVSQEKRVDMLHPVLKAFPEARLAVAGDGPDMGRLREIFADTNTVFTGFLNVEELAAAYASADIFAFPSANETFGNVVLEAMASGLPVVVPRSGGVVNLVTEGENGLFFDTENVDSFIEALRPLIENKAYREKIGAQAHRFAKSHGWENLQDELLDDFEALIKAGPTHSQMPVINYIKHNPVIKRLRAQ